MLKEKKSIVEYIKKEKFMLLTGIMTIIITVVIAFQNILTAFLFLVVTASINGFVFGVLRELEKEDDN